MKSGFRKVLTSEVNPVLFALSCSLLVFVLIAAKIMTEDISASHDSIVKIPPVPSLIR